MIEIKLYETNRGFMRGDFTDLYGSKCSIQESSLAEIYAIWLGVHEGSPEYENKNSDRMHLTQEMVEALIPLLHYFVENGVLPDQHTEAQP